MQRSNLYTYTFALIICVFASVLLALASTALKPAQQTSQRLDIVKNLLSVTGITNEELAKMSPGEIMSMYKEHFEVRLVDKNKEPVERSFIEEELKKLNYKEKELSELKAFELIDTYNAKINLLAKKAGTSVEKYDRGIKPVYVYRKGEDIDAYIVPIAGPGLWGMMYGYIALKPDLNTVAGIRFYKHQETPGLGGEAEKPWFTSRFEGKHILNDEGEFVSVKIAKGGEGSAENAHPNELDHYVDGISGATITTKGINEFLKNDLQKYEPYFKTIRSSETQPEGGQLNQPVAVQPGGNQ